MRIESNVTSLSWIPSEAIEGMTKLPFELGVTRYDPPPPDVIDDLDALREDDRFRFANELRAWIDVEGGRIQASGYSGKGHINVSKIAIGPRQAVFQAIALPDLRRDPEVSQDSVRFVQTAGGRTGMPAPRRVRRPPFVQISAPLAWTTLALTIHSDGSSDFEVLGASPFPRHWIYDSAGKLAAKSGLIDFKTWYREAFGVHSPWGAEDSPALVTEVETALERELSRSIMRGEAKPRIKKVKKDSVLCEQGQEGNELFLLLDGVLRVEVNGEPLAEMGPGAILGERAILEGGKRTSTLRAVTPCRVAVASGGEISKEALAQVATGHRREEQ